MKHPDKPNDAPSPGRFSLAANPLRMKHTRAFVFLHSATPQSWGRILSLWLRRPSAGWLAFRRRWVQSWGGSYFFHVVIGNGEVILDPHHLGNRFWPQHSYAVWHPDLCVGFEVPVTRCMRLGSFKGASPGISVWRVVLKFLTRGRFQTNDCVTTVKAALANGGVSVPARVCTPLQLKDWLYANCSDFEIFA